MTADISGPYREHQEQPFAVCAQCVHVAKVSEHPERWRCSAFATLGPVKTDPLTGGRSRERKGERWCVQANPEGACNAFEKAPPEAQPPPAPPLRYLEDGPTPSGGQVLFVAGVVVVALFAGATLCCPPDQVPAAESPR